MKTIDEILDEWYPTIPDEEHNGLYARDKVKLIAQEFADQFRQTAVSCWVAFDWNKIETRPTAYGKYLIRRKDGKIHWETWNGSGWAYNHNEIRFWAVIVPPCS